LIWGIRATVWACRACEPMRLGAEKPIRSVGFFHGVGLILGYRGMRSGTSDTVTITVAVRAFQRCRPGRAIDLPASVIEKTTHTVPISTTHWSPLRTSHIQPVPAIRDCSPKDATPNGKRLLQSLGVRNATNRDKCLHILFKLFTTVRIVFAVKSDNVGRERGRVVGRDCFRGDGTGSVTQAVDIDGEGQGVAFLQVRCGVCKRGESDAEISPTARPNLGVRADRSWEEEMTATSISSVRAGSKGVNPADPHPRRIRVSIAETR